MEEERPYGYYPRIPYKMGYGYSKYNIARKQNADVQNRTPQYRREQYKKENKQEKTGTRKQNIKVENPKKEEKHSPIFEIFGIKLYFDDILLIALIFFLYDEGVQDNMLFIALILLLLS